MMMMDRKSIKYFVKKTLCCTCTDDVFQYIECETDVDKDNSIVLDHELNVGNRLLIYIVSVMDERHDILRNVVSYLVRLGTEQRDKNGFNRFRLVLLASDPRSVEERASEIFYSFASDDKVHLHVIGQDEFEQIE